MITPPPGFSTPQHPPMPRAEQTQLPDFWYQEDNTPVLLVDTSYLSFYRFFSTQIWYHKLHPEANFDENYDWTTNIEFMNRFTQNYMSSVDRFRSRYNIPFSNVIFCRDCPREKIWRMNVYSNYKSNRKTICRFMNRKFQVGPVFRNIYQTLIPQLETRHGFHVMKIDEAEADDLVAVLTRTLQKMNPKRWVFILTNDHDYLQLASPRVEIWSLQNRLLNRYMRAGPKEELEHKIWAGDTSDTIPSCWDNIPWAFIVKLCDEKERDAQLEIIFGKYPQMKESYQRNKTLIDFNEIPTELQSKILYQATPFFMGSNATAMNWSWNGPMPMNEVHPVSTNAPIRRPIGRGGSVNYPSRIRRPIPQQAQIMNINGILNRSGSISWSRDSPQYQTNSNNDNIES